MQTLNFDTIKQYQSFNSIEDMDKSVRSFLYKHKSELSEATYNVLKSIWTHSVKVIGVSFAKYDYIADQVKISRRTVIRAVNKLEEMGIIKRIPTVRANKKRGVNIIVVQEWTCDIASENNLSPQDVTAHVTPNKTENKQSSLCEKKKPNNVHETSPGEIDHTFLPENIDKEFIAASKPFLSVSETFKLWNRVLIAYRKTKLDKPLNLVMDSVISAFKQSVFAKKMNRIKSTFEGYFYSTLYAMLVVEKRKECRSLFYDFLR
ncbi:helix-turn-helix domain-containing protein [Metabacillus halosaccharovorans]|uniref:helix-turn-helix domain-containing protein n=1 Tax=Metabacillus halosaccharovorans TaxID=930124 RepID=UPI0034CF4CE5